MVRDMDMVRTLMLGIEQERELDGAHQWDVYDPERLRAGDYPEEEVAYHLNLLIGAGMVEGDASWSGSLPSIRRLTWQGHDFVESMKNRTVWEKAKTIVIEKGGGMSIALLAGLLEKLLKQHFGLE